MYTISDLWLLSIAHPTFKCYYKRIFTIYKTRLRTGLRLCIHQGATYAICVTWTTL